MKDRRCSEGERKIGEKISSLGGLEPPTFRLTAERANRLRHRDLMIVKKLIHYINSLML